MKVLIIGPSFFSYAQAMKQEFLSRSIYCDFFDDIYPNTIKAKILYRLGLDFFYKSQKKKYCKQIVKFLEKRKITDIIFISPRGVTLKLLTDYLINDSIKLHLYMWDSLSNQSMALGLLHRFHTTSSFDPNDCVKYNMTYIPLFAEKIFFRKRKCIEEYDLSFCGTLHSSRPIQINKLIRFMRNNEIKGKFLLYYHSRFLLLIQLLFNNFSFNLFNKTKFKSYSKNEIAELFFCSNVVIDISHFRQSGLTSRTFESLASGAKLITTNKHAFHVKKSLQSRIFILKNLSTQEDKILEFIRKPITPISLEEEYFLSLDRFTDQIIKTMNHLQFNQKNLDKVFKYVDI